MIGTLTSINWLNLKRDRVALMLTFILPLIFFTIFAYIFGGMAQSNSSDKGSGPSTLRVVAVDEDHTEISRRFIKSVGEQEALSVFTSPPQQPGKPATVFDRNSARQAVRQGEYAAAIVVPRGFGAQFGNFDSQQSAVDVFYDEANPMVQPTVSGLLQAAAMMAAPDILMEKGLEQLDRMGGTMTDRQRELMAEIRPYMRGDKPWNEFEQEQAESIDAAEEESSAVSNDAPQAVFSGLVKVNAAPARTEARNGETESSNIIAYYAAGIGIMFLLFSMAGAGGFLLEQQEIGTLERILTAEVGMTRFLVSNWMFISIVGMLQLTLMFMYGELMFNIGLFTVNRVVGCAVMIGVTSIAAAAFAIILATAARSRAQLGGISTIVILIMSALGGSMVPRFVAPAVFEKTSPFTFNGWALDGFLKVFWYDDPDATVGQSLAALGMPALVLLGMTVVFLIASRILARRWEAT